MNTLRNLLLISGFLLLTGLGVAAQQPQDATANQLREQIQRLEAVDRDATTTSEVRELNRTFLRERRIQLRALLRKNLDALRSYLSTVDLSLKTNEKQIVQNRILQTENDLKGLERDIQENSSAALSTPETPSAAVTSSPTSGTGGLVPSAAPNEDGDGAANSLAARSGLPVASPRSNPGSQPQPQSSTSLNATLNARIRSKVRVDQTDNTKQTETPSMSASSTSLVDQSSASDLIGVATNLAGLSATSNKNQQDASSVSVTASAYSLLAALNRVDPLNPVFYNEHRAWRNFSITLGYDDEDQANGTKQRAKLFGAKYLLINRRDPNLKRNKGDIDTVTSSLEKAAAAFGNLSVRARGYAFSLETVRKNILAPGFKKFLEKRKPEVELALERARNGLPRATTPEEKTDVEKQIKGLEETDSRIDILLKNPGDPNLFVLGTNSLPTPSWTREELEYQADFLNEYLGTNYREKLGKEAADAVDRFIDQQLSDAELVAFKNLDADARAAVEHIRRAPQLSVAFLSKQRKIGLDEYMGEVIFDYGVANRINLSLNGSYDYKNSKVIGADTRGFAFAGQLQFQLNRENLLGKKPFFLDVSTQGSWMTGTRATYRAQGKFTIPIADGIDFPISVTYANRTELIKERTVKAQFGFTVDTARLIRAFIFR